MNIYSSIEYDYIRRSVNYTKYPVFFTNNHLNNIKFNISNSLLKNYAKVGFYF